MYIFGPAKEPAADEVRFRVVKPRGGRQIDQGQIQDCLEPCFGEAASGPTLHHLPEASASRLGARLGPGPAMAEERIPAD